MIKKNTEAYLFLVPERVEHHWNPKFNFLQISVTWIKIKMYQLFQVIVDSIF